MMSSEIARLKKHIRQLEKELAEERARKPSRTSKAAKTLIAFLSFALGCLGLLIFWPRMTVDPGGDLDVVGRKMSFKVTNTGFTTLHEVQPILGLCQIAFGGKLDPKYQCGGPLGSKLLPAMLKIGTLTMDEKQSFRFDDGFQNTPNEPFAADISVIIRYEPAYLSWLCLALTCEKEFRFETRDEQGGKISWQSKSTKH
jgi:hypothetical protein